MLIRVFALIGNLVVARFLDPRDFGLVALGAVLVAFGTTLADGGLGGGLIRREGPVDPRELQAVFFAQLLVTSAVAAVVASAGVQFGIGGRVAAVMVASLPLQVLRTPGTIMLERSLDYRPVLLAEVADSASYATWAIGTVAAGWGVWGLASATVVRAAVGSAVMLAVCPAGRVLPRPAWQPVRQLLGFGLRLQAVMVTLVFRDQLINVATGALGGLRVLGLWSLAYRLMTPATLLFETLWRVSLPAMARLVEAKQDLRPTLEKVLGVATVSTGLVLCPLPGSAPALVPSLFGRQWAAAAAVLPFASLALVISGPVSAACVGYLYARGDAGSVLRATLWQSVAWVGLAAGLLPLVGVTADGLAWIAGGCCESALLARAVHRHLPVDFLAIMAVPVTAAVVAGGAGIAISAALGSHLWVALLSAGLSLAIYAGAVWLGRPTLVVTAIAVLSQLRESGSAGTQQPPWSPGEVASATTDGATTDAKA